MKPDDTTILEILADELFNRVPNCIRENVCWNKCLSVARRHSVIPLTYKGAISKRRKYDIEDDIVNEIRSATFSSIIANERLLQVQDDVITLLNNAEIRCVVLKGSSVAICYPHPELRELGDVDILVSAGGFQKAVNTLILGGYISHEAEHEFHSCFSKNGVHVELHHAVSVFPENAAGRYAVSLFASALDKNDTAILEGHSFPVLLPVFQLLSLLFHMKRHMTESGISLRQLCDWAVAVNYYRDIIDQRVLGEFERCGMLRFAKVLTRSCVTNLCLPDIEWCRDVDKSFSNAMLNEILDSDNMSNGDIERSMSSIFVGQKESSTDFKTLFGSFIINNNKKAKERYPIAQQFPIVLAAFWIIIPLKYLLRSYKGERPKASFWKVISTAYKRKRLYSKLGLYRSNNNWMSGK